MNRSMAAAWCEQCGTTSPLQYASFCHACGHALRRETPAIATPRRGNLYLVPAPGTDAVAPDTGLPLSTRCGLVSLTTVIGAVGIGLLARLSTAQTSSGAVGAWWVVGMLLIAALVVVLVTLLLLPRRAA